MGLRGALSRNVLIPVLRFLTGKGVELFRLLGELEESQWWPADLLRELQAQRLADIGHAAWKTPLYAERMRDCGLSPEAELTPDDLRKLPPLTKEDVRQRSADLAVEAFPRKQLHAHHTGGSTGEPTTIYRSTRAERAAAAMVTRHDRWAGWDFGERQAALWGAERDLLKPKLLKRFRNWIVKPQLLLNAFRMTEEQMTEFVYLLGQFRPRSVLAYASAAYFFSRFVEDSGAKLAITPRGLIASADTLYPDHRAVIERAFNCPVFERYGCREVGIMASECDRHTGMHVCAEHFILEVVRPDSSPCAPGEAGEVLVTSLTNLGAPLLRYRIGDMTVARGGEQCPCGRGLPLLGGVEGRTTDMFRLPGGTIVHGEFFTHLFYGAKGVKRFQVVQDAPGHMDVNIVKGDDFDDAVLRKFRCEVREFLEPGVGVDFHFVPEIETGPTGKHRFTISKVGNGRGGERG